ncbi:MULTISPECIES: hypothetical protein [Enterobacter cloacae complex]|uniref:hypothetical protein n=1 Tax=Enterobacter cloacae complex TaxID=354276 RepID=UPI00100F12D6|nr:MULTISPECIES: hypothetical protein [Enterobacter cloacae complex]RYA68556.1 hypothetical protein DD598_23575 [Enterobacter cloacae complex sp. 2DZ2F16B1]HCJ7631178.1 hypothetical protein [Enterobacter hormaechei subsp. xiangfangensis]HED1502382.1 hypothetical protein [Enterobacter hormaechei subsp. hoffmannii]EKS6407727.1 hypothetical protein [Enterobacter hormaechei]ELY2035110.1 hypothetical protein [Enterobacter hormaechei]
MNIISYIICSFLMFFVGNIQNWLKPYLISHQYPSWLYDSFPFYAIIYVAVGLLSTFIAQALKPKTATEKEISDLKRQVKRLEKEKQKEKDKTISEETKKHQTEISRIRSSHRDEIEKKSNEYEKEILRHKCTIKAKDQFISSMTIQLAEKFETIENYNKESAGNSNKHASTTKNNVGSIMPDIGDYS